MKRTVTHTKSNVDPNHIRILSAALDAWHGKQVQLTAEEWELAEVMVENLDTLDASMGAL